MAKEIKKGETKYGVECKNPVKHGGNAAIHDGVVSTGNKNNINKRK